MSIQYLLDEHIPPLYRTQLVRRAPELIIRIIGDPDAPPKGTLDPDILIWCEVHNFILVTNNHKSIPKHLADHLAQSRHIPGILGMDLGRNVGDVLEELILIAGISFDGEYQDRIEYLLHPPRRCVMLRFCEAMPQALHILPKNAGELEE